MKKKLLFIIPSLCAGGAEKSLVTLLNLFDYDRFEVDLLVFRREGLFADSVPEQVTVYTAGDDYLIFDGPMTSAVKSFAPRGRVGLAAKRIDYSFALKNGDRAKTWKLLSSLISVPDKQYDCAIGYLEGNTIYCCVDKVKAAKKIGFIHSDYGFTGLDPDFDRPYFEKLSAVVTVSEVCRESLLGFFPEFSEKLKVVYNILSPGMVRRGVAAGKGFDDGYDGPRVLTVGRIAEIKGIDLAVRACALLRDRGYNFRWYEIGDGEKRGEIEALTEELSLREHFILLGERANPYEFTGRCDIYVQPSRIEGKSIAIDEAKALQKPIVSTAYPSVADQIAHEINGLVCEISPEGIADAVGRLLDDAGLRESLSTQLASEKIGNEEEIERLYELL